MNRVRVTAVVALALNCFFLTYDLAMAVRHAGREHVIALFFAAASAFLLASLCCVIWRLVLHERFRRERQRFLVEQSRLISPDAHAKAVQNLIMVARAVGARYDSPGRFVFQVQGKRFVIDANYISRQVASGPALPPGDAALETTCYQVAQSMPAEEKIATAMLYLKSDPNFFDLIRGNHGVWFGAAHAARRSLFSPAGTFRQHLPFRGQ